MKRCGETGKADVKSVNDEVILALGGKSYIKLSSSAVEVFGLDANVVSSGRTFYSKRTTCIGLTNGARFSKDIKLTLGKRFHHQLVSTNVGDFLVIIFPGEFRYDRLIASQKYICVEHSREERVSWNEGSIIILF